MNLFYLHYDPQLAAISHCDKHVVKMIIEYAQLLSTAHRLLDGRQIGVMLTTRTHILGAEPEVKVKKRKFWLLPGEELTIRTERFEIMNDPGELENEPLLSIGYKDIEFIESNLPYYFASHINHPCGVWARDRSENYEFLAQLFKHLCAEYRYRYGRMHHTEFKLGIKLQVHPENIPAGDFYPPPLAMPDEYKAENAITAYQALYVGSKSRFAKWTNRRPPEWFIKGIPNYDPAHFERTSSVAFRSPTGGGEVHQDRADEHVLSPGWDSSAGSSIESDAVPERTDGDQH